MKLGDETEDKPDEQEPKGPEMNKEEIEELDRWLKKYLEKKQFEQEYAKDLALMSNAEGQAPEKYFQPEKKSDIYDEFADGKVELHEFLQIQEQRHQNHKKIKKLGPATANNMTLDRLFNVKGGATAPAKRLSRELDGTSAEVKPKSSDDVEEFKISTSMFLDSLDADSEPSEPATAPAPKKAI